MSTKDWEKQIMRNLKAERLRNAYTQKDAEEKLGLGKNQIWRWENIKPNIPIVELIILANLYNCQIDDFLTHIDFTK